MDELAARTLPMPRVLWIELTSRCPFDCVFCSRKRLRGAGEHLDFALYQRLIGELESAQIIRLNYAGESGHYPRLAEAVALAVATGAQVELVSALASLKPERLQAMLEAGLSRLSVSLHTLDPQRFDAIYRFGSLATMLERLDQVLAWRERSTKPFELDLAFVAMQHNLDELPALSRFAQARGIQVLAVHPLIGRDPLPMRTDAELAVDGSLQPGFRTRLESALAAARAAAPNLAIQVSSYELNDPVQLAAHPQPWSQPLPPGARIGGCDQSPFDSVHVLADGSVVACEVTEKIPLGNLHEQSLADIWHGANYQAFRERHLAGREAACRRCIYKTAYLPAPAQSQLSGRAPAAAQLLRGWHADDGSGVRWSGAKAAFWLARRPGQRELQLDGVLGPSPAGSSAGMRVRINGELVHRQPPGNGVNLRLPLPLPHADRVYVELDCEAASSPQRLGLGVDVRELGFALIHAELR